MNITEFAALKVGDVVENGMTMSKGSVVECVHDGVKIAWGTPTAPLYHYTVQSTAWFQWERVNDGQVQERQHEAQGEAAPGASEDAGKPQGS